MKKIAFLACAALLTSVVLTGCKDKKAEPEAPQAASENVEEQGANEVVKTQFAISLPNQLKGSSRKMPSANVQRDGLTQFQGMTGIILVPFATQTAVTSSNARLGANITTLGNVAASDIDRPSSAKVYNDVTIPLSTAAFLFYAKSAASNSTVAEKFNAGSLIPSNLDANTPASFLFSLEQIQSDASAITAASADGGKLLAYLTSIANADNGTKKWREITAAEDAAMKAMFDTYATLNSLSSFAVERVLSDLNKSLKPLVASNATAAAIATAINNSTYASVNASDEVELISALDNFPGSFNLPDGAINIKWESSSNAFVVGDYANMATPDKYVYPAQLWYYVNSNIKTSNTSKQTMYDNSNNWSTILAAHTDAVSVNSRTRAVAITNAIQYAVARFDVQVRLNAASLEDNSATVVGARTDIDCSAGFPVSAVFVGGQTSANFDFTATAADALTNPERTIYDRVMASTQETTPATMMAMPGSAYSALNHTLVLENGTSDVRVAVELTNTTGKDFYGAGGQLIPKNGKFYVVGQLTAADATETGGHVFKQDFTTTAKLTLKDLKTAYNTIPDLRTPQLELGFSVDLTWQNGHLYEVDFN